MEIRSRIRRTYNTMDKGKRTKYKQLPTYLQKATQKTKD